MKTAPYANASKKDFMKLNYSIAILTALALTACAQTKIEKDVQQEVAEQPARPMHGGVARKGLESIESSTTLKPDQKAKLRDLHQRMMADTFRIQEETSRLKGVLFETLTATPYNKEKVEVVKKQLVTLNNKKLDNMFSALAEFEKVIGYIPPKQRSYMLRDFFYSDNPNSKNLTENTNPFEWKAGSK